MQFSKSNEEPPKSSEQPNTDLLDPQKLESIRSLDPDGKAGLLKRVMGLFLEKSPSLVQQMTDGQKLNNTEEIYRAAHSLKSSSATIGAMGLSEICRLLEMAGRQGNVTEIPELIKKVKSEFSVVCMELTRQVESL
jgi:HPt (histidine-containing phosphotransfer) domain-containing protein